MTTDQAQEKKKDYRAFVWTHNMGTLSLGFRIHGVKAFADADPKAFALLQLLLKEGMEDLIRSKKDGVEDHRLEVTRMIRPPWFDHIAFSMWFYSVRDREEALGVPEHALRYALAFDPEKQLLQNDPDPELQAEVKETIGRTKAIAEQLRKEIFEEHRVEYEDEEMDPFD